MEKPQTLTRLRGSCQEERANGQVRERGHSGCPPRASTPLPVGAALLRPLRSLLPAAELPFEPREMSEPG